MTFGHFIATVAPPAPTHSTAARAVLDTIGVTLAGSTQPASLAVQEAITAASGAHQSLVQSSVRSSGPCRILGTQLLASASDAALANGTAAHALDFDDMCFVSLAHPSAPLVSTALAVAELRRASGRALLDAYVVGFEIEARLGRAMNPRHYQRGWHCTSTIGTVGAAAAACRLLGLDEPTADRAVAIAASQAAGLKENFGTMVKPLHAGLAARNGVTAALLAKAGLTASPAAIQGPQGLLAAMDSESASLAPFLADLGDRWEILDTGITVKLYPSCAATHPAVDALLDLRRSEGLEPDAIERVQIGVDPVTPTVLIYDRPATGLEGKFSMAYCAASALVHGRLGIDSFDDRALRDSRVQAMQSRVAMRVALDQSGTPLTRATVTVTLRDGRELRAEANGARGYPERPASDPELSAKFLSCASMALDEAAARKALSALLTIADCRDIGTITTLVVGGAHVPASRS